MHERFIQGSPWRVGGAAAGSSCAVLLNQTQQTHCSPPTDADRVAVGLTGLLEAGVAYRVATVALALVRQLLVGRATTQTATCPLHFDANTQHGALQLDAEHQRVAHVSSAESHSEYAADCMKSSFRQVLGELVEQQLTLADVAAAFKPSKRIAAHQQISTG